MTPFLLRSDNRHIRAYTNQKNQIKFFRLEDELLPIKNNLFASSSSLKADDSEIEQLKNFIYAETYLVQVNYQSELEILIQCKHKKFCYILSEERTKFWKQRFIEDTELFPIYDSFGLKNHQGRNHILEFLDEIQFALPNNYIKLFITYGQEYFFIPFEFASDLLLAIHCQNKHSDETGLFKTISLIYNKELYGAPTESEKIAYLTDKRNFIIDNVQPELLFVADHGTIENNQGKLVHNKIEEKIKNTSPKLTVLNSCHLARIKNGIIFHFLNKNSVVIASPFRTPAHKSVFSPLLKFLYGYSYNDIVNSFAITGIFYPSVRKYFRIFLP